MNGPQIGLDFVILCLGRTGSTHLQFLLDSHPGARCLGELFTGNARPDDDVFLGSGLGEPFDYVAERMAGSEKLTCGFKMPLESLRAHPDALGLLDLPNLKIIRITRRNRLALFVSRRMLATTLVPQSTHGSYGEHTVRLDPTVCLRALDKISEHDEYLDSLASGKPTFRLTYEELVGGGDLSRLLAFLGLPPHPLTSVFERLRKRPLSATVANWDELCRALTGTPHERYLVDDLQR